MSILLSHSGLVHQNLTIAKSVLEMSRSHEYRFGLSTIASDMFIFLQTFVLPRQQ